jgi:hypothetical protein
VELAAWRAAATHVATGLRIGPGAPVVAPFSMPVPECTRVQFVNLMTSTTANGTPFYRYTVEFGTEASIDSTNPLAVPGNTAPEITVTADSVATPDDKPGSASSEVDGHPAYRDGGFIVIHGVDGFALEIHALETHASSPDASRQTELGRQAIAVYRSIHFYPGAKQNPGVWATPVA